MKITLMSFVFLAPSPFPECSWEDLLKHLEEKLHLKMLAGELEINPPGDIILFITRQWEKKEPVPVSRFCEVAGSLGFTRVQYILQDAYKKEVDCDPSSGCD